MTISSSSRRIFRGSILHFLRAPTDAQDNPCYEYFDDAYLIINQHKIERIQPVALNKPLPEGVEIIDYAGKLIMPGFVDTHIHYPQTEVIASYGEHLLAWLETYVFPTEKKYQDFAYAYQNAKFFLKMLLSAGTTTAMVYSTVHKESADALFTAADELNMRMITGKILMDKNSPEYLCDTPETAYTESMALIEKWHRKNRLLYAVTPRFAPTSSEKELFVAKELLKKFPDVYLQTHIAENKKEVAWVKELFPWSLDYTDVYDHFGLLGKRSIFGHAIYFSDREFKRFTETGSVCAWCPTSNFFLGSGLFDLHRAKKFNTRISLATDIGAGTSFSMLSTLGDAYKTAALQDIKLSPLDAFYQITLGNAKALSLENYIGNFEPGKEADFVVIDLSSTPLLAYKMQRAKNLEDILFNLMILGDDRAIYRTYIHGETPLCELASG